MVPHHPQQILHEEGLDHIVVGAELAGPVDVRTIGFGRCHDENGIGQIGGIPDLLKDLEPVHRLHQHIADDHRGALGLGQREGFGPVQGLEHGEATQAEEGRHDVNDVPVVVHHEDGVGHQAPGAAEMPGGSLLYW